MWGCVHGCGLGATRQRPRFPSHGALLPVWTCSYRKAAEPCNPESHEEHSMADTNKTGPLAGIKVVEMGIWVAGPAAAAVLGDWGAEVIKIENPAGGDPVRGLMALGIPFELPVNPSLEVDNRN